MDSVALNGESWFLARCHTELYATGTRAVISFADPVPRVRADGTSLTPGHVGWIYQASNGVYTGRGTARTLILLPDGTVLNARSGQKVRQQEQGHDYVERRLIAMGTRLPRAGVRPADWLADALADIGVRRLRHRGNHRYVFPLGPNARVRRKVRIALGTLAYPKQADLDLAA